MLGVAMSPADTDVTPGPSEVEGDGAEDVEAAWAAEIERRVAEIERGEQEPVPADEVFARYGLRFRAVHEGGADRRFSSGLVAGMLGTMSEFDREALAAERAKRRAEPELPAIDWSAIEPVATFLANAIVGGIAWDVIKAGARRASSMLGARRRAALEAAAKQEVRALAPGDADAEAKVAQVLDEAMREDA
jgi:hypothetical protein